MTGRIGWDGHVTDISAIFSDGQILPVQFINNLNKLIRQMNSSRELKPLSQTKPVCSSSASSRKKSDISINRQPFVTSKNLKAEKSKVNSVEQKMSSSDSNFRSKEPQGYKNIKKKITGGLVTKNKENIAKKELSTTMVKSALIKEQPTTKPKTVITPRSNIRETKKTISNKHKEDLNQTSQKKLKPVSKVEIPKLPLTLNQFQMGKKLGKGRFGDVYIVREKKLGFVLAMKVINKEELIQSDMQSQLIFEIKIQTFLNHPNTLRMYGCFSDQKNIYLLLELAAGGCLFRELRGKGSLPEDSAAYYLRQIVVALKHLHSHSVMHRDIKPENILNNFGVLKLCDFGWSVYSPLYQRQTFCGTLDYVPPQIVTGDFYDQKVDIWCLGILCYQLCTGKAPFEAKNSETETYDKILALSLDFPVTMSVEVVDFISKLLCKNPKNRMSFEEIETHPWMKRYENQTGRMISKEIWDSWLSLKGGI